jgi:hypothetical protein
VNLNNAPIELTGKIEPRSDNDQSHRARLNYRDFGARHCERQQPKEASKNFEKV